VAGFGSFTAAVECCARCCTVIQVGVSVVQDFFQAAIAMNELLRSANIVVRSVVRCGDTGYGTSFGFHRPGGTVHALP
jgi:hypothetical protein